MTNILLMIARVEHEGVKPPGHDSGASAIALYLFGRSGISGLENKGSYIFRIVQSI
jgi:hypothetical protein